MAKKKISAERAALVSNLISEFDLKNVKDVERMFKELFSPVLQGMLEAEMDDHLGYEKYEHTQGLNTNTRNGHSSKTLTGNFGNLDIDIPRDREGEFEPQVVKKHQRDISDIEHKVISMYGKGMTTRDITSHLNEIYGVELSAEMISKITDRIMPEVRGWQQRPLENKYLVMYLDAIHYHVKQDNVVVKKAVYIAIGIKPNGYKEVLGMYVGQNESAKFWLTVLNDIKSRGVQDILIACVDGLSGFVEAIEAVYPLTDVQRCIIHQIRSSYKLVVSKDVKAFMRDLKKIYKAATQEEAMDKLIDFEESWGKKYSYVVKSWKENWNNLTAFFNYPMELRKLIYTTNTIEAFNRQLRKVTKTRSVFPTDDSLMKILFLAMRDITAKWTSRPHNWGIIYSQLMIQFPDRITEDDL